MRKIKKSKINFSDGYKHIKEKSLNEFFKEVKEEYKKVCKHYPDKEVLIDVGFYPVEKKVKGVERDHDIFYPVNYLDEIDKLN